MKKQTILALLLATLMLTFSAVPAFAAESTPQEVLEQMMEANVAYRTAAQNDADIGLSRREDTAVNGQTPYAVVVTCSDSRVPAEHLFLAGIGELFVIRTAGNVVGDFELGSVEYGTEHLGAKVVLVLGHSGCGAVAATLGGHAEGKIAAIVDEIALGIGNETESAKAEDLNVYHGVDRIMESDIIRHLVEEGEVIVIPAKYDLHTGAVTLLGAE